MNCSDARFRLAAEPSARDAALDAHLQSCAACSAYAQDMLELDGRLRAALAVPVPDCFLNEICRSMIWVQKADTEEKRNLPNVWPSLLIPKDTGWFFRMTSIH